MIAELLGNDNMATTEEALLRCPPLLELKYQNNETSDSSAPMNQGSSWNFVEFCKY